MEEISLLIFGPQSSSVFEHFLQLRSKLMVIKQLFQRYMDSISPVVFWIAWLINSFRLGIDIFIISSAQAKQILILLHKFLSYLDGNDGPHTGRVDVLIDYLEGDMLVTVKRGLSVFSKDGVPESLSRSSVFFPPSSQGGSIMHRRSADCHVGIIRRMHKFNFGIAWHSSCVRDLNSFDFLNLRHRRFKKSKELMISYLWIRRPRMLRLFITGGTQAGTIPKSSPQHNISTSSASQTISDTRGIHHHRKSLHSSGRPVTFLSMIIETTIISNIIISSKDILHRASSTNLCSQDQAPHTKSSSPYRCEDKICWNLQDLQGELHFEEEWITPCECVHCWLLLRWSPRTKEQLVVQPRKVLLLAQCNREVLHARPPTSHTNKRRESCVQYFSVYVPLFAFR